jgi:hypothetical protein
MDDKTNEKIKLESQRNFDSLQSQCWICPTCYNDHASDAECAIVDLKLRIRSLQNNSAQIHINRSLNRLHNLFFKNCWNPILKLYDHMHDSTYLNTLDFLIEMGRIKPEECVKK